MYSGSMKRIVESTDSLDKEQAYCWICCKRLEDYEEYFCSEHTDDGYKVRTAQDFEKNPPRMYIWMEEE